MFEQLNFSAVDIYSLSSSLSFSEYVTMLKPLVLFILGMVVYSVFIFKFYRFLARKDIFSINLEKYSTSKHKFIRKGVSVLLYMLKHVLIFPLFVFFWFGILFSLLVFLSKTQTVDTIMLIAMSIVAAVRITSYYNEDLSKDLAKMLPFALLGIFLVDISYFNINTSIEKIMQIPSMWKTLIYYMVFVISLELVLRVLYSIKRAIIKNENTEA